MDEFSYEKLLLKHTVFKQLSDFKDFYFSISENSSRNLAMGIEMVIELNSIFFESMKNTIDSIIILLEKGRLGDGYTLLRRYEDLTLFQTYTNLKIKKEFSIDNLIVEDVNNWLLTNEKAPGIKNIDKYLKGSDLLEPIYCLFKKDEFENIRIRSNNFTHFNDIQSVLLQDAETLYKFKNEYNQFQKDILKILIRHFAFALYLNGEYITDEDYFVGMDVGIYKEGEEEPGISPIIQIIFDKYIKPNRPDVAKIITERLEGGLN